MLGACRGPFFVMADVTADARRKAQGKPTSVISPLALEAVRRIDALFEIERTINGQSPEPRRAVRQELSAPLVAGLAANLRAGGLDIGERKAGHDFHQLSPIGSTAGGARDGNAQAEEDGRERENKPTSSGWTAADFSAPAAACRLPLLR
jgi:hypothetical protein